MSNTDKDYSDSFHKKKPLDTISKYIVTKAKIIADMKRLISKEIVLACLPKNFFKFKIRQKTSYNCLIVQ